jgi:hypothetical protein
VGAFQQYPARLEWVLSSSQKLDYGIYIGKFKWICSIACSNVHARAVFNRVRSFGTLVDLDYYKSAFWCVTWDFSYAGKDSRVDVLKADVLDCER